MDIMKAYKIGAVDLVQLDSADIDSTKYSDDAEETLYEVFKSKSSDIRIKELLSNNPSWPVYYHLSPFRKNVIDWYEFKKGANVLEVGAGCGAITEALCDKNIKVTALELTKRRAEINAYRNKGKQNLEIVIGNLENYQPKIKFDYVICVGVLEYAGGFINSDSPYEDFLKLLGNLLSPEGILILAIENRLGLKYFSGSKEDHTGGIFDSINQYPTSQKVQTFGRTELKELTKKSGFKYSSFYYPYPDYKNPMTIYSDEYFPGKNADIPIKLPPNKSFGTHNQKSISLFSEQLSMISVEKNNLYRELANSFIVLASKSGNANEEVVYFTSTPSRKDAYNIKTYLKNSHGRLKFYKEAVSDKSEKHLDSIYNNFYKLKEVFDGSDIKIVAPKKLEANKLAFEFIEGATLERILFDSIVAQDYKKSQFIIDQFIATVDLLPGGEITDFYLIDLNFDNIIVDNKGNWNFIDYEWLLDKKVNKRIITQRSLIYFISRYSSALKYLARRDDYVCVANDWYFPGELFEKYSMYFKDLYELAQNEKVLQSKVSESYSGHTLADKQLFDTASKAKVSLGPVEEILYNPELLTQQRRTLHELNTQITKLKEELNFQTARARRAELTSPYYLPKKVAKKLKNYLSK